MKPRTIVEKIWDSHVVAEKPGAPALLYIDLHLTHEVTSPQAFSMLRERGLKVRRPDLTIATMDHSTPTTSRDLPMLDTVGKAQLDQMTTNCKDFGIRLYDLKTTKQGIVHVIGPELGHTQPGRTIVCGDSHTSTHGAFGALAFGIGTSEVEHVLATQCLLQRKPKTLEVRFEGALRATAVDGAGVRRDALDLIKSLAAHACPSPQAFSIFTRNPLNSGVYALGSIAAGDSSLASVSAVLPSSSRMPR